MRRPLNDRIELCSSEINVSITMRQYTCDEMVLKSVVQCSNVLMIDMIRSSQWNFCLRFGHFTSLLVCYERCPETVGDELALQFTAYKQTARQAGNIAAVIWLLQQAFPAQMNPWRHGWAGWIRSSKSNKRAQTKLRDKIDSCNGQPYGGPSTTAEQILVEEARITPE